MTNYSNLSNEQLYIQYQEAKANFRNAIEGTQEELEADSIFTELSKEVEAREDFDWLSYKLSEQPNKLNLKGSNNMKNSIKSILKTTILCLTLILIIGVTTQQPASASTRSYSHHATSTSTTHRTYTKHATSSKTYKTHKTSSTHKTYKKSSTTSHKHSTVRKYSKKY